MIHYFRTRYDIYFYSIRRADLDPNDPVFKPEHGRRFPKGTIVSTEEWADNEAFDLVVVDDPKYSLDYLRGCLTPLHPLELLARVASS